MPAPTDLSMQFRLRLDWSVIVSRESGRANDEGEQSQAQRKVQRRLGQVGDFKAVVCRELEDRRRKVPTAVLTPDSLLTHRSQV